MEILSILKNKVISAVEELEKQKILPNDLNKSLITIEKPKDESFGELSTNVSMILAKQARVKPRDLATKIVDILQDDEMISSAEIAGPGFINFRIHKKFWIKLLNKILEDGEKFGFKNIGENKTVNIEFVSANPTGPLHVGHTRGAIFGDVLANLLNSVGFKVTREYYINDAGAQIDSLARSAYSRYQEALGIRYNANKNEYPGDYLKIVGQKLKDKFGKSLLSTKDNSNLEIIKEYTVKLMINEIKKDLSDLGVFMDSFVSENSLYENGKVQEAIDHLTSLDLIYRGILAKPKGSENPDWVEREQDLFKATMFGDDIDRPIKKIDGGWTYFAPDIAYHYDKIKRNYDEIIDIFGADHSGYITRMKAIVKALSRGKKDLKIKLCQLVKLYKEGKPVKMSKRSGTYVTLRDLLNEVGKDSIRFLFLMRKNDAPLDFDFTKAIQQTKDNPVFYVQYANARICSILKRAKSLNVIIKDEFLSSADLTKLSTDSEISIIRKLSEFPNVIFFSASRYEPHRIAFYLNELAQLFHSLQSLGKIDHNMKFLIEEDMQLTNARIALIRSIQIIIISGLKILGVKPIDEML
ncbi:MAG: arginine--tRNA ligase [Paracoccaceae bacterium]